MAHRPRHLSNAPCELHARVHSSPIPSGTVPASERSPSARLAAYLRNALTDPYCGHPVPAAVIMEVVHAECVSFPAPPDFVRGVPIRRSELGVACSSSTRIPTWLRPDGNVVRRSSSNDPRVRDVDTRHQISRRNRDPIAVSVFYDKNSHLGRRDAHTRNVFPGRVPQPAARAGRRQSVKIFHRDWILENVREQIAYTTARLSRARVVIRLASATSAGSLALMLGDRDLIVSGPQGGPSLAAPGASRFIIQRGRTRAGA